MHYVYILESLGEPGRFYVGVTKDLRARLRKHNEGDVFHTSEFMPWRVRTYLGFSDEKQASASDKYLKSAPGSAFAKKRF